MEPRKRGVCPLVFFGVVSPTLFPFMIEKTEDAKGIFTELK